MPFLAAVPWQSSFFAIWREAGRFSPPMNLRTLLPLALAAALPAFAADAPLLAIPGKVIYESKLDTGLPAPWKAAKGKWESAEGALRGSEKPEDKHGAVARLPNKLGDFIAEYEVKLDGARSTTFTVNAVKDHMARIMIGPSFVQIQRDDNDHEGPDKAVVYGRFKADMKPGTWHKVRMEMVGDTMLGQVDDIIAAGSSELFKQARVAPGFTVAGQSAEFRNLKITEATLNPEWEKVKATLPKGEKAPPAKRPGGTAANKPGKKKAE
jgi:hypothetical protein